MSSGLFRIFSREEWASLRLDASLTLSGEELAGLRSLAEPLSLDEVEAMYLPVSRLLQLHVRSAREFGRVQEAFLARAASRVPFVIAIAGSVAAGKSTFARVLETMVSRWPGSPRTALVTTDGFLYPNAVLEERGLMKRKGFPESYDLRRLMGFLAAVKAGEEEIAAPVYSHLVYDIVAEKSVLIRRPEVLIFEGLNVLQVPHGAATIASDYFDFSIYLDADEMDIERWYVERFLVLQQTAFQQPQSYFRRYRDLPPEAARRRAAEIWREINLVNLRENIQPTRQRADLVLRKRADHTIGEVWLRQA